MTDVLGLEYGLAVYFAADFDLGDTCCQLRGTSNKKEIREHFPFQGTYEELALRLSEDYKTIFLVREEEEVTFIACNGKAFIPNKVKSARKLVRTEELDILQFRANMYKHAKHAFEKTCWRCNHAYAEGESVGVCITSEGNHTLCTNCATEIGLMELVDEKGFVKFKDREPEGNE